MRTPSAQPPTSFAEVLRKERELLRPGKSPEDRETHGYTGLAFSGGGIRSATFNLGVLQALARLKLLRRFDYLSTVSGGGYIGGWLAAWIRRAGIDEVERRLARDNYLGQEIELLREYSNYLTPRKGMFSGDTWTVISMYLRNLSLNLMVLVTILLSVLLLPHLLRHLFLEVRSVRFDLYASVLVIGLSIGFIMFNYLRWSERQDKPLSRPAAIRAFIVTPWVIAGWFLCRLLWEVGQAAPASVLPGRYWALSGAVTAAIIQLLALYSGIGAQASNGTRIRAVRNLWFKDRATLVELLLSVPFAFIPGAAGGFLLHRLMLVFAVWEDPRHVIVFGPALVGLVLTLASITMIGMLGPLLTEEAREWWSRVGGSIGLAALTLTALMAAGLYGPQLFDLTTPGLRRLIVVIRPDLADSNLSPLAVALFAILWLVLSAGGLAAGRGEAGAAEGGRSRRMRSLLVTATPYVFVAGLVLLLAKLADFVLGQLIPDALPSWSILWLPFAAAAVAGALSSRIDVNLFSMNALYRHRLSRCYLGASNRARVVDRWTGLDPGDDMRLDELLGDARSHLNDDPFAEERTDEEATDAGAPASPLVRPFLIVNTALNLVAGKRLAWQKRKAMSFIFTPLFSGYELPPEIGLDERGKGALPAGSGFRETASVGGGTSLATAMSISGAAASPNMGYRSTPAMNFLLTVFNVRLGAWLGNTRHPSTWRRRGPRFALLPLIRELFGQTDSRQGYVYLSDGGHFENLGIYELVRRRCSYIVACDAEHDAARSFEGLGGAIEKCRTDFGVDIEIDVSPLRLGANSRSKWHCAVGRIRYDKRFPGAKAGRLVYIKSTLTGDEPTDVLKYALKHDEFPHETTADQWFDESQFESYRALGYHSGMDTFEQTASRLRYTARKEAGRKDVAAREIDSESLFLALAQRWRAPAPGKTEAFTRHGRELMRILTTIRETDALRFLDGQIYPEWADLMAGKGTPVYASRWLPSRPEQIRAGFYICSQMLRLMENVYLDLEMGQYFDHPDNRGWMNLFRHWTGSSMFRVTWAIGGSTYGARFQNFCAHRLSLAVGRLRLQPVTDGSEPVDRVRLEEIRESRLLNFLEVERVQHFVDELPRGDDPRLQLISFRMTVDNAFDAASTEAIEFRIGFAILAGETLCYLRIQDHLRNMGLGRKALLALFEEKGDLDLDTSNPMIAYEHLPERIERFEMFFRSAQTAYLEEQQAG